MNKKTVGLLIAAAGLVGICVLAIVGVVAYQFLQAPQEVSAPIEAIPLVVATDEPETDGEVVENNSEAAANESAEETVAESSQVFTIQQSSSEARFELDEDLRGNRITVVGTTDQVAGQISVDYANLAATELGAIQVNARTIATDNDFRNRAINNRILETGSYEFITFTPTSVNGLADSVSIGETVTFEVVGDLTIRDITHSVVFNLSVTAVSASEISGSASTTVTREMYGLTIPSVPSVANVEEEIELYIDFVATSG